MDTPRERDIDVTELPMFPLSTVLLPYEHLPLHVFEDRYRAMIADCLDGDRRFGVVLIERGPEVGGGDTRLEVGTLAEIEVASPTPGGRFGVLARGSSRLFVREWLVDAPYPRALKELESELDSEDLSVEVTATLQALRGVRALWAELGNGLALPDEVQFGATFEEQIWRLCSATPLGPLDRERLLEASTPRARLDSLYTLIKEQEEDYVRLLDQRDD